MHIVEIYELLCVMDITNMNDNSWHNIYINIVLVPPIINEYVQYTCGDEGVLIDTSLYVFLRF